MAVRLSKSGYVSGLQCLKRLYLEIHAGPRDALRRGNPGRPGRRDPGGGTRPAPVSGGVLVDVEYFKVAEGLARMATLLADPAVSVLYEGFIAFDDLVVRPDILIRTRGNRWRLIEVKSTSRVKDEHLDDLAIQAYVLTGAGLSLDAACLLHLNTGYLYPGGPLDLRQLFQEQALTREVADRQGAIPARLAAMRQVLANPAPPAVEPDDHCTTPYECPVWDHCTEDKPDRWIYHLWTSRRWAPLSRSIPIPGPTNPSPSNGRNISRPRTDSSGTRRTSVQTRGTLAKSWPWRC